MTADAVASPVSQVFGGYREGDTPVPIPNTEVKPLIADGTARVAGWESRTLPRLIKSPKFARAWGFFYMPKALIIISFCGSYYSHFLVPVIIALGDALA